MKLEDLLKDLKIGTNYCSINLIEYELRDCMRMNYLYVCYELDEDKFKDWCKTNKIIYGKVEYKNELVYRLDRFN